MQSLRDAPITKAQRMNGSPFAKHVMVKIDEVEDSLLTAQGVVDILMKVQSVWLCLGPIFGFEDIMKLMPTEWDVR